MNEERGIYVRVLKRILERRAGVLLNYQMELRDAVENVEHLKRLIKATEKDIEDAEKELGVDGYE